MASCEFTYTCLLARVRNAHIASDTHACARLRARARYVQLTFCSRRFLLHLAAAAAAAVYVVRCYVCLYILSVAKH